MAVSKDSEPLGLTICDESDAVVELCMSCPYPDCIAPDRGCEEMHKLKKALRAGEEYHPPESWGASETVSPEAVTSPQALLDKAWAKLEAKPKARIPKPPAMEVEELPSPPIKHVKLHHFNEAIAALEVLHDDAVTLGPDISTMIQTLKRERATRYDCLIDWSAVARGGSK